MVIKLGRYKHYKGNLYEVIGTARNTETLEILVIYRALYDNYDLCARPLEMFCESVIIDEKNVPRFTYISESAYQ